MNILKLELCGADPAYCCCGLIHSQSELDAAIQRFQRKTVFLGHDHYWGDSYADVKDDPAGSLIQIPA